MYRFASLAILFLFGSSLVLAQSAPRKKTPPKKHKMSDTVGVVNGEVITLYDFRNSLSATIEEAVERGEVKDKKVTNEQMTKYVDSTWDELIGEVIIQDEIFRRHFSVSDSEAIEAIVAAPPPAFKQEFTDSLGRFQPSVMRYELEKHSQDSAVSLILNAKKLDMERQSLIIAVGHNANTAVARKRAFETWLTLQKKRARIVDRRTAFGYY